MLLHILKGTRSTALQNISQTLQLISACPNVVWLSAELERSLREAHAAGDEHIGDIGSMEAVLDRIKAGFMGNHKKGLALNPDLNAQLQAMRMHKLPAA